MLHSSVTTCNFDLMERNRLFQNEPFFHKKPLITLIFFAALSIKCPAHLLKPEKKGCGGGGGYESLMSARAGISVNES